MTEKPDFVKKQHRHRRKKLSVRDLDGNGRPIFLQLEKEIARDTNVGLFAPPVDTATVDTPADNTPIETVDTPPAFSAVPAYSTELKPHPNAITVTVETMPAYTPPVDTATVDTIASSEQSTVDTATVDTPRVHAHNSFDRADLDAAKSHLLDYLIHIGHTPDHNGMLQCICKNHVDNHPSMKFNTDTHTVHCFACNFHGDIVDVIAEVEGLPPKSKDAIDRAINFAGIAPTSTATETKNDSQTLQNRRWTPALKSKVAIDYLHQRGFGGDDKDLIERYNIAFDQKTKCLIIPHDGDYYTARAVGNVDKAARFCHNPAMPVTLFNGDAINTAPIIAVTEGAIDALSLIACNLPAVALGGAGTQSKFIKALEKSKQVPDIIVAFDNDKAGNDSANKLFEKILQKFEVGVARLELQDSTDVNELFCNNRAQLRDSITKAIKSVLSFKDQAYAPIVPPPPSQSNLSNPKAIAKQMIVNRFGLPVKTASNFDLIFEHDPIVNGIVAFNALSNRIELTRKPHWRDVLPSNNLWQDVDDNCLQNYIDREYSLRAPSVFNAIVDEYAYRNTFHPIRDFFKSLPAWDGTPRAETLLVDQLGADNNDYTRAVTKHWLLAAVARVFHPGCKFDFCLVLKGKQGIGKSTLLSKLGGQWFGELDSIQGKDAVDKLQGLWIVELVEMQATKKADNELIKSFLSTNRDRARLSYDRRTSEFPRQCVFAATTNEHEFLRDQTGGRRFWIVDCQNKDFKLDLPAHTVKQVWAEVFHCYQQMFVDGFDSSKLDIPFDVKSVATDLQKENTDGSDLRGVISAFLSKKIPHYGFWRLFTKDERKQFMTTGKFYMPFNRALNSPAKCLPCKKDELEDHVIELERDGVKKKFLVFDSIGDTNYDDYDPNFFFDSDQRQKISPVEILYECFDGERSKLTVKRIADIMRTLDIDWRETKGSVNDPVYGRQKITFVRVHHVDVPNAPADPDMEPVDDVDIPF